MSQALVLASHYRDIQIPAVCVYIERDPDADRSQPVDDDWDEEWNAERLRWHIERQRRLTNYARSKKELNAEFLRSLIEARKSPEAEDFGFGPPTKINEYDLNKWSRGSGRQRFPKRSWKKLRRNQAKGDEGRRYDKCLWILADCVGHDRYVREQERIERLYEDAQDAYREQEDLLEEMFQRWEEEYLDQLEIYEQYLDQL